MGHSKREMLAREDQIVRFVDLGELINAPVKQYSSGRYIRLAFAVATEVDPDILLLNEVLPVGDIPFRQKCTKPIKRFHDSGKTILFVTHSPQHVISLCDRAILLDSGDSIADGSLERVIETYYRLLEEVQRNQR